MAVSVLHWGAKADTLRCLASVAASRLPPAWLFVLDNGTGSLADAEVEDAAPGAVLLRAPENLGFAAGHNLVMRRAMPDDEAKDFGPLDKAERIVLFEGVDRVVFQYFGSENDFTDPAWVDSWEFPGRVPQVIRLRILAADGTLLPDMVVRLMLGEEAGCLESAFQRVCRPRRDT